MVLEFCDGPDLEMYMKQKNKLPEEEALMILRRNRIIHRDLKPANIFSSGG
jgi:serine/threonine protein kinase